MAGSAAAALGRGIPERVAMRDSGGELRRALRRANSFKASVRRKERAAACRRQG
jgi:hypothetical protein